MHLIDILGKLAQFRIYWEMFQYVNVHIISDNNSKRMTEFSS